MTRIQLKSVIIAFYFVCSETTSRGPLYHKLMPLIVTVNLESRHETSKYDDEC